MEFRRRSLAALPLAALAPRTAFAQSRRAGALEAAAQAVVGDLNAGTVLVAQAGQVLWAGGVGPSGQDIPKPSRNTVFDGLSIGKVFTSLAIMRLADAGRVDLSARVRTYLPELPEAFADMRVRHALNNDTGLPVYLSGEDFTPRTDAQALAEIAAITPERKAGTGNRYSNVTFHMLALLVQRVSGAPIHEAVRRLVIEPAGLRRTGFFSEPRWRSEDVATGWVDGKPKGSPTTWPHTWALLGAAGIATTVDDLYRLNRAFMAGAALSPLGRARLLQPGTPTYGRGPMLSPDTIDISYGAGFYNWLDRAGRRVVFAGGDGDFGFHAVTFWRREDDVYLAGLFNRQSSARPFDRASFVDRMLEALPA